MEDNKTINAKIAENAVSTKSETQTTAGAVAYDPDDYMYEDEYSFYYDDICFSCKNWLEYECGAPNGACNYEPF